MHTVDKSVLVFLHLKIFKMLALYLLAVICAAVVTGYPDGAPISACDTLTPVHSTYTPQPTASPYVIGLATNTVPVGGIVSIMLMGTNNEIFQGFLLKAIPKGATTGVAGEFTLSMLQDTCKYLNCSSVPQSALTHTSNVNKTMVGASWSSSVPGTFNIIGTVAATYDSFWVGIRSEDITVI